jgi:RIO kinase 2
MAGLDIVALRILANKDVVYGMGKSLGVGKESDVYEAITQTDDLRALKFFRIGRISFRDAKRKRTFADKKSVHNWLLVNIEAAKKEYDNLRMLKSVNLQCPFPFYRAMHCIVMNRIEGTLLYNFKNLTNPTAILDTILSNIRLAFKNNIINCDISEYNIMIDKDDVPWIIDWPQAVTASHPNAQNLLERDIYNIINFFNRRYGLRIDFKKALESVSCTI